MISLVPTNQVCPQLTGFIWKYTELVFSDSRLKEIRTVCIKHRKDVPKSASFYTNVVFVFAFSLVKVM